MNFEEFQQMARLYVVGALDDEELETFLTARKTFGPSGEQFLVECQQLNEAFALSLTPERPKPETKIALLDRLRQKLRPDNSGS